MMITDEEIKQEWESFGEEKPWYCEFCDALLSLQHKQCDGRDEWIPVEEQVPHEVIKAKQSISFEDFKEVMKRWHNKQNNINK